MVRSLRLGYLSSHPPRECGLATFTADVVEAVNALQPAQPGLVIAVNDGQQPYAYRACVRQQIDRDDPASYREAAWAVNLSDRDAINIQHEYGLFGGEHGSYLLEFIERVRRPLVLTLHTLLPAPSAGVRDLTRELVARSARTVVLARAAMDILRRDYGTDPGELDYIPHGVPNVALQSTEPAKEALRVANRRVALTCGLINPGKGIEYAIQAMAGLVAEFPDLLYVVVGETHPGVRVESGEAYREELQAQVDRLGLEDHVRFVNRYLDYRELVLYLLAADVYVVPYLNLDQIVSGTVAYALGCGRAIVSTPSTYAREVLADGRGALVPPRDASAISMATAELFRNDQLRTRMQREAYEIGHSWIWPNVAQQYMDVFEAAVTARHEFRRPPAIASTFEKVRLAGESAPVVLSG